MSIVNDYTVSRYGWKLNYLFRYMYIYAMQGCLRRVLNTFVFCEERHVMLRTVSCIQFSSILNNKNNEFLFILDRDLLRQLWFYKNLLLSFNFLIHGTLFWFHLKRELFYGIFVKRRSHKLDKRREKGTCNSSNSNRVTYMYYCLVHNACTDDRMMYMHNSYPTSQIEATYDKESQAKVTKNGQCRRSCKPGLIALLNAGTPLNSFSRIKHL